jgi:hypothetical protein
MSRLAAPLSNQQIASYVRQAGFPEELVPRMVAIANAESGRIPNNRNPNAATGDNSYGLFQINMLGAMGPERRAQFGIQSNEQLYDPLTNAKAAKAIYDQQGLDAWTVHRSGAADQYMPGDLPKGSEDRPNQTPPIIPDDPAGFSNRTGNITINNYYGDGTETKQKQEKNFAQQYIDSIISGKGRKSLGQQLVQSLMNPGGGYGGKLNPMTTLDPRQVLSLFN